MGNSGFTCKPLCQGNRFLFQCFRTKDKSSLAEPTSALSNRLPNNTQITTNNISGLLCRSRPLRFIEDQRSLKNRIVKNTSQNTSRKINRVLDTYLQETLGGQEKSLQKTRERREKIEETWVGTKPKKLVETKRRSNSNRVKCYFWNQSTDLNKS